MPSRVFGNVRINNGVLTLNEGSALMVAQADTPPSISVGAALGTGGQAYFLDTFPGDYAGRIGVVVGSGNTAGIQFTVTGAYTLPGVIYAVPVINLTIHYGNLADTNVYHLGVYNTNFANGVLTWSVVAPVALPAFAGGFVVDYTVITTLSHQ